MNGPHPIARSSSAVVAHNVRRLMAEHGLTYDDVVEASGLDARTVRAIVRGEKQTQARTLQKLARALGAAADDLFSAPEGVTREAFDAATNPEIERVAADRPELFEGWGPDEFADLASRFGVGGALTPDGVVAHAQALNEKRRVLARARVVLESSEADLFARLVELMYERVTLRG